MREDGKQGPRDGNAGWQVTFRGSESVAGGRGFEEEQRQEDKHLGPNSCAVCMCVDTESLESGKNDEEGSPTVIEREGQVNKDFVPDEVRRVNLFDDVINVGHRGRNKEGKNEGYSKTRV
jgi:hypothetical protein